MRLLTIIFLLTMVFNPIMAHPIKMTTGELQINASTGECTLIINFFIDDFESEMRKIYSQPPFNFESPDEIMKGSIAHYINSNLQLFQPSGKYEFIVDTILQTEMNICQVKLETQIEISLDQDIELVNSILFSSFPKQVNVLKLFIDGEMVEIFQFFPGDAKKVFSVAD